MLPDTNDLSQAEKSRRWYDSSDLSKQLTRYLYVLDTGKRGVLAERVGGLLSMVELYLAMCTQSDFPYQQRAISSMVNDYLVKEKPEEVQKFLSAFRQTLKQQLGFAPVDSADHTLEQLVNVRLTAEKSGLKPAD